MSVVFRLMCFFGYHAWDSYDGAWRGCTTCLRVQHRVFGAPTDPIVWRNH